MAKIIKMSSKKQEDQSVPANPFLHIDLFPGFVPRPETIAYVDARFGGIRTKPHPRIRNGMSLSSDTIEDAKVIAAKLIMKGLDRGEIEFTPGHPIVVTTDKDTLESLGNVELGGKIFYVGFEWPSQTLNADL